MSYWLYGERMRLIGWRRMVMEACEGHEMKVVYPSMPGVVFLRTV